MFIPTEATEIIAATLITISPENAAMPMPLLEKAGLMITTDVETIEVAFLEGLEKEKPQFLQNKIIVKLNAADLPSLLVLHHMNEEGKGEARY